MRAFAINLLSNLLQLRESKPPLLGAFCHSIAYRKYCLMWRVEGECVIMIVKDSFASLTESEE